MSPEGLTCFWDNLTDEQREAATILGYNRKGWNEEAAEDIQAAVATGYDAGKRKDDEVRRSRL